MTARVRAAASGYAFKEWQGSFYPAKIKPGDMLAWYARRLPTVEINHTCYRVPEASVPAHRAGVAPDGFRAPWAERIGASARTDVHACFMHEPTAPGYAKVLLPATARSS
jgi:hypothetical protein